LVKTSTFVTQIKEKIALKFYIIQIVLALSLALSIQTNADGASLYHENDCISSSLEDKILPMFPVDAAGAKSNLLIEKIDENETFSELKISHHLTHKSASNLKRTDKSHKPINADLGINIPPPKN
jgi:hypothetical protein